MAILRYFIFCGLLLCFSCVHEKNTALTIAASANMQYAIEALVEAFTEQTSVDCQVVLGASGNLTAQISEGAPFDVFLSADAKYPEALVAESLGLHGPEIYAVGSLILYSADPRLNLSIASLQSQLYERIVIANPRTAPYGRAARQALKYYKLDSLEGSQIVQANSVAQTNVFLHTKAANVGLTAKSILYHPRVSTGVDANWIEIPSESYAPILQSCLTLKTGPAEQASKAAFFNFLMSEEAREILEKFGYQAAPRKNGTISKSLG